MNTPKFELTILGSSSALPMIDRFPSAHALNVHGRYFLIDCGEGTQIRLRQEGISPVRINHIFISHLHGDHMLGLFGLLSSMSMHKRSKPLHIYGPAALSNLIQTHLTLMREELNYSIEFHSLEEGFSGVIYEDKVLCITAFPLNHRVICFGYRFQEKIPLLNIKPEIIAQYQLNYPQIIDLKCGRNVVLENDTTSGATETLTPDQACFLPYEPRSYAYCSDTQYAPEILPFINNVQLLYHEATFDASMSDYAAQTAHSTTIDAANMATQAHAQQLLIGHYSSRYHNIEFLEAEAQNVFPNTTAVKDGDKWAL